MIKIETQSAQCWHSTQQSGCPADGVLRTELLALLSHRLLSLLCFVALLPSVQDRSRSPVQLGSETNMEFGSDCNLCLN